MESCCYCGKKKPNRKDLIKLDQDGHKICQSCMRKGYWKTALGIFKHNKKAGKSENENKRT